MADREKVANGLRCIKGDLILCVDCAYSDENGHGTYSCKAFCANDALALLKEQNDAIEKADSMLKIAEDKIKELLKEQEAETIECEMCGHRLQKDWNWCPWCRWETALRQEGR